METNDQTPTAPAVGSRDLVAAIDPFRRALAMQEPLNPHDEDGLRKWLPGVWPKVGDLRRLIAAIDAVNATTAKYQDRLFGDLKTDIEKAEFFESGRAHETGIVAASVALDIADAFRRAANDKLSDAGTQASD